ncbi:siderophore-interacting protein [Rhodoligotrophos defluvii]|uniref:siderophore-interacting protein n=1 Tax=Rhodoligotrophos defluvii TaxID=2561934 RepID=UPI0010C9DEDC|nr:siderophore-interacting protein [Rhodoligotrophos defluvii]
MAQQSKPEAPRRREPERWHFRVVDALDVGANFRRVLLRCDDLSELAYKPGQALVLELPMADGQNGWRDYTIRYVDRSAGCLAIDFLLHGDTPGPNWARAADKGKTLIAYGPRGRIVLNPGASWHLFCGDETCLPAILHILEEAPAGIAAHVLLEVAGPGHELPVRTAADLDLTWIHRGGGRPGPSSLVLDRLAGFTFPPGLGHAYIIGETSNVRAQRRLLLQRGLAKGQISAEGYWRPGRIGGHDHVD